MAHLTRSEGFRKERLALPFAFGSTCALHTVASILLVLASSAAIAQQAPTGETGLALPSRGSHSGLLLGSVRGDYADARLRVPSEIPSVLSRFDANDGSSLFGSYRFSPSFVLGGAVTKYGKLDAMRDSAAPAPWAAPSRAGGIRFDAVGIVPLVGGFSVFGKVGTLYTPSSYPFSAGGSMLSTLLGDPGQKLYAWNATYGLGASYDVSSNFGLHLKYERANSYFGDARTSDSNVGIWSFGLIKRY